MMFLLLLAAAEQPFLIRTDQTPLIKRHCELEWPDDLSMREICVSQAKDGMRRFREASQSVGRPLDDSLARCIEEGTEARIPNWQRIGVCAEQQAERFRKDGE